MRIQDSGGKTVVRGTVLESTKHKAEAKKAYCVGVTEQYVILAHDQKQVLPWVLTVDEIAASRWAVSGWRDLVTDPLGK